MIPHPRVRPGFTPIELLVVISVVAILASMLMPLIAVVRRQAIALSCGNNQRHLVLGFLAYAVDFQELPTCYQPSWIHPGNWGDETTGRINSPRGPATYADGTAIPTDTDTPYLLAFNNGYVTTTSTGCQKVRPPYGGSWFGLSQNQYNYNGPGATYTGMGNNGRLSGLFILGGYRYRSAQTGWSQQSRGRGPGAAQTALLGCPGISNMVSSTAPNPSLGEPHGAVRWSLIAPMSGVGNGQDDFGGPSSDRTAYDSAPYNRNVTFADGHLARINTSRANLRNY